MRGIRETLSCIISGGRRKKSELSSIEKELIRLVGRRRWTEFRERVPDQRGLLKEVAKYLSRDESEILQAMGKRLGLPIIEYVEPMDIEAIKGRVNFSEFREKGVVALTSQGVITGLACVEPAAIGNICSRFSGIQVYLSLWDTIVDALDESEKLYREHLRGSREGMEEKAKEAAEKVIAIIIEQALRQDATEISIDARGEDGGGYSFCGPDGEQWQGAIDARVRPFVSMALHGRALGQEGAGAGGGRGSYPQVSCSEELFTILLRAKEERLVIVSEPKRLAFETSPTLLVENKVVPIRPQERSLPASGQRVGPSVLLVDDNETFLGVLDRFFQREGYVTRTALSAEDALALMANDQYAPELIVTDLCMPGVGGLGLIQKVRGHLGLRSMPIIVLSTDEDPETEYQALEAGANLFVPKTKDPRLMGIHAKRLVELRRAA